MERDKWLAFCRKRALEFLDRGDMKNAMASMVSDLTKNEETAAIRVPYNEALNILFAGDAAAMRGWINRIV